ncbi:MAG: hypothetical protein HQL95_06925 [Magnetococcales bacterium]|nr:hypothetical protein [Magnetococcales bacterium]
MLVAPVTGEAALHRKACETPYQGVSVCWDAVAEDDAVELPLPYAKMHLLPIARQVAGQPEVWVDMSRTIFRQLLTGHLADQLVPEWTPVYHLEGALALSQSSGWPAVLWIAPRETRNSSATSAGLVDWDVYLISKGRLMRTVRVRVESRPNQKTDGLEKATVTGSILAATGALAGAPIGSMAAIAGSYAMGQSSPPEAGQPLELMTELATRQVLFLFQQTFEYLPAPRTENGVVDPLSKENMSNLVRRPFEPK